MGWRDAPVVDAPQPKWAQAPAVEDAGTTAVGLGKSAVTGLLKGVAGIAGLPSDIKEAGDIGAQFILRKAGLGGARKPIQPLFKMPGSQAIQDAVAAPFGGLYEPKSTAEEYTQTVAGFLPNAVAPGGAIARAASVLVPGVASEAAGQLTKGTAAEPWARGAAAVGSTLALSAPTLLRTAVAPKVPAPRQVVEMRKAGYVIPPSAASSKPSRVSSALAGASGQIKTEQLASAKNQQVTKVLAARSLKLPPDTQLDQGVFDAVRDTAGRAYEAVKQAPPVNTFPQTYVSQASQIGSRKGLAAQFFPKITQNKEIDDLSKALTDIASSPIPIPTEAIVDEVRFLRASATSNLKAIGAPEKHALGLAQREAAELLDDLMEYHLARAAPKLIPAYKDARTTIAKSYDLEGVTNPTTGEVNARGLARLYAKRKPLSNELLTIAKAAGTAPKAMQVPSQFGGMQNYSALDFFGSAASVAGATISGNPAALVPAAAIVARPGIRSLLLSKPYQDAITGMNKTGAGIPALKAAGSAVLSSLFK